MMNVVKSKNLSPEDQKILDYMIANRKTNGDIGWELKDGPEAVEWLRYYKLKYPHKVSYMLTRITRGESYLVPSQWPQWFDSSYAPADPPKETEIVKKFEFDRMMMTENERVEIIKRVLGNFER